MALWQQDVSKLTPAFVQLAARPNGPCRTTTALHDPASCGCVGSILQAATGQGEDEGTWALRTETLAEVLIARQDGRCRVCDGKALPSRDASHSIATDRALLADRPGRAGLCNAILDDLAAESQVERVPNRSFWVTLQGAHPGLDAFRDAAKTRVQQRATAGSLSTCCILMSWTRRGEPATRTEYWNHVRKAIQSRRFQGSGWFG